MKQSKNAIIRSYNFSIASQVSLLLGIVILVCSYFFRLIILFQIGLIFLLVVSPSLALYAVINSIRTNKEKPKFSAFIKILVLSGILLLGLLGLFSAVSPYIYTPPALTSKNIVFYKQCVEFVQDKEQYKNLVMSWSGRINIEGKSYLLGQDFDKDKLEKYFSSEEIKHGYELSKSMRKFRCIKFKRVGKVILFYKYRNKVLPNRPGIAYVMDSENPNELDINALNQLKPFVQIKDNWYMSKKLILTGRREYKQMYIPKSLFDFSLRTKGL